MNLNNFKTQNIGKATELLFNDLNIPINVLSNIPVSPDDLLEKNFKHENEAMCLMNEVFVVGLTDEAAFENRDSIELNKIQEDYKGILIFGVNLKQRENNLLPTRSQLAEITRAFNREFFSNPVVVVFSYNNMIAFSNCERLKYKQNWRDGEKAGKVSILRDISIENPHSGHLRILNDLKIKRKGKNAINTFADLYKYWQEVFNVSILNKKFYQELQSWYFWAIKEVTFPNHPKILDEGIDGDNNKLEEALKEHKGKNVIRLLTRILFIWFIKEKGLIPEAIFDEKYIADNLLKDFTPQKPQGVFATGKHTSMYYRAILQNLFFSTLNQEMGKREFRKDKAHMNVTNLMRYQSYFKKDGDTKFVELMESVVPFMNGGLFECLDKPHPTKKGKKGGDIIIYEDGFSDRTDNVLQVPDYLFFDVDEEVDISDDIGSKNKIYKHAKTKGLLELLKSYKFTITENTPIEEDVALDPELLGKVFENLLASYNPETKTTARKQTGSFYTPREIVNYMVDESLIAYLKNKISNRHGLDEKQFDTDLHTLVAFDNPLNPFADIPALQKDIIKALDRCKILDPACGSGAFPMGILQKMVHVLHKIDPNNNEWKQRQIDRVDKAIEQLEGIEDSDFRERSIKELEAQKKDIEEAFTNNELDYGRKLYLIENCIYGVDIQSIATQISKLRFFISLVVDQKINHQKPNFGIRPLPNLETKFVAANTLIGIDKPDAQGNLFDNDEVKKLEEQLKKVRNKLFSSKSPKRKRELRNEDKQLRNQIAEMLEQHGWANETARQLSSWDPYDQNATSSFFDPEWMFGVSNGFDVVIGNPPYVNIYKIDESLKPLYNNFATAYKKYDLYVLFFEQGMNVLKDKGVLSFITSNKFFSQPYGLKLRELLLSKDIIELKNFRVNVFDATVDTVVSLMQNSYSKDSNFYYSEVVNYKDLSNLYNSTKHSIDANVFKKLPEINFRFGINEFTKPIIDTIEEKSVLLHEICYVNYGCRLVSKTGKKKKSDYIFSIQNEDNSLKDFFEGKDIRKFNIKDSRYVDYMPEEHYLALFPELFESRKIVSKDVVGKSGNLQFAFDEKGFYNDHTVINAIRWCDLKGVQYKNVKKSLAKTKIELSERHDYYSIIGLLNSKLLYWYFDKLYNIDLHFYPATMQKMPIYKHRVDNSFSQLVSMLIFKYSIGFQDILDALVFNLYFPDHMQEHEIDVLQFVGRDIAAVYSKLPASEIQKQDVFDTLSDTEKEQVIEQLHQIWTDPNNEVVKRMAQFKEKSPDILKVIMES